MADYPLPPPIKDDELAHSQLQLNRLKDILTIRNQPWMKQAILLNRNWPDHYYKPAPEPYTADELEDVLKTLAVPDRAEALVLSAVSADIEIAKKLLEIHGQIPMEVTGNGRYSHTLLNGKAVNVERHFLGNAKTPADMSEAIEWMPTVGLGWMLGLGSERGELYWNSMLIKALEQVRAVEFEGELPSLVQGLVEQPELLVALHAKKIISCVQKAYDSILCWIPEKQVAEFPGDLIAYKSVQDIVFEDPRKRKIESRSVAVRLVDVDETILNDVQNDWVDGSNTETKKKRLTFKEVVMRTIPAASERDIEGEMLLSHQANNAIQHGFWNKPGMVLCRTSVDFLTKFEFGNLDAYNEALAFEYVRSYTPVDLMAKAYGNLNELNLSSFIHIKSGFSVAKTDQSYYFNDLLKLLNAPEPLRSNVRSVLSKDTISFLTLLNGSDIINPESLSTLYREYGIDNSGIAVSISSDHVDVLYKSGFKFSEKTVTDTSLCGKAIYASIPNHVAFKMIGSAVNEDFVSQNIHTKASSMGLWISSAKQPLNASEALMSLTRRKLQTGSRPIKGQWPGELNAPIFAYRGYLLVAGVDACVEIAKTAAQWKVLADVFSTDELKPYLEKAPLAAKAKIFSRDLGM